MALELQEAPPPPPDVADRRVLDAQVLLQPEELRGGGDDPARRRREVPEHARLRRRAAACSASRCSRRATSTRRATTCRRRSPRTRARSRSSRRCSGWSRSRCARATTSNVDAYLARLQNLPAAADGAGDAVRARQVLLLPQPARRRGGGVRVDPARPTPTTSRRATSWPPSRSRRATWPAPASSYDALLKTQAPDDGQQGRPGPGAAGDRAHPLRAIAVRQGDRGLPVDPAPVEVLAGRPARAGLDVHQGQGLAARLSLGEPAAARRSRHAATRPDLRILEGNLQLRMSNFYLASDAFSKVRDEFEPIHRQLQAGDRHGRRPIRPTSTPGRQEPRQVRHRRVRSADGGEVGQGRAGSGAHDGAGDRRGRHAARSGRQPEAGRSHPARDGGDRAGSASSPTWRRARTKSAEIDEPAGRHAAEVRRQDPRRSSTRC